MPEAAVTEDVFRHHTFKIREELAESKQDVCIQLMSTTRDCTRVLMKTMHDNNLTTTNKLNIICEQFAQLFVRLNCCSALTPHDEDSDDMSIVSSQRLDNGDVAVTIQETKPKKTNAKGTQIEPEDKINRTSAERGVPTFTIPCLHAMDPDCLKNFCRSRMNAGQFKFRCPKEGCGAEWRYKIVRSYCNLTAGEEREFETKLSRNYAEATFDGVMKCPGCSSLCVRNSVNEKRVQCPHCKKMFKFERKSRSEE